MGWLSRPFGVLGLNSSRLERRRVKLPHRATRRPRLKSITGHVATKAREAIRIATRTGSTAGRRRRRSERLELPCSGSAAFPIDFGRNAGVNCQSLTTSGFRPFNARQKSSTYGKETWFGQSARRNRRDRMSSCSPLKRQDIKLYAFSSGALTIGKGICKNLATGRTSLQIPVGLLRHQAP